MKARLGPPFIGTPQVFQTKKSRFGSMGKQKKQHPRNRNPCLILLEKKGVKLFNNKFSPKAPQFFLKSPKAFNSKPKFPKKKFYFLKINNPPLNPVPVLIRKKKKLDPLE